MKSKIIKISFVVLSILLIIPSLIYLISNKTIMGFDIYFNFFLNDNINKIISTSAFLVLFILLTIIYFIIYKMDCFKNIKRILIFITLIGIIFMIMLPWTSSDIFYYMGVGELDARYNQNPYYVTMREYYIQNEENLDDDILLQGATNYWGNTTVVYGPIAQLFFKICSFLSMKNITVALFIFKFINLLIHIINTYLFYKISGKKKFAIMYGLNPFIFIEAIANVHNDIIILFFILLSLYFLLKRKNLLLSIVSLALATGVKYFTVLLLPVLILYHFRTEKRLSIRFLRCIEYGVIFLVIFALEYVLYFNDYQILLAMMVQTSRYQCSIYSVLLQYNKELVSIARAVFIVISFMYYAVMCINLLTEKNIKFYKIIRKYNIALILFLLILTNFHQWYLIWLFATIIWQKPNTIRNIIGLSLCTEIANSAYMFLYESYKFDKYFVGAIIVLFIIWKIITNKESVKNLQSKFCSHLKI